MFVLSKLLNFILLFPSVVRFTMDLQTGHLEDRGHARIVLLLSTMKFSCIFFFFFFLRSGVGKPGGIW